MSAATVIDVLVGLRGVRATLRGLQGSGIAEVVVRLAREGGVGAEEQAIGVRALQVRRGACPMYILYRSLQTRQVSTGCGW